MKASAVPEAKARVGMLAHVLILDLSGFLAGPYCTQILADLGARVIKIESPAGDMTRTMPPHFVKRTSAYFHSVNRNKESVVIDLKQSRGREILLRLVAQANAVVENFRPGVMERLGLSYAELARVNPKIVLCSISGFGQGGPYADRPAYDMVIQALSGSMSINGEPGQRPVRLGIPIGDLAAGMFGAIGTLAALHRVTVTGNGQHVDVSMLDSQISMLSYLGVYYLLSGEVPGPQGRGHLSIPTYRSFTCADGMDVIITANTEKMWQSLCRALELTELLQDPRFQTNEERLKNKETLWEKLEAAFCRRSAQDWLGQLQACGIPAAPVNTLDKSLNDAQVLHRHMVIDVRHPDGDTIQLLGNPIKTSPGLGETFTWAPELGEQSRAVLEELLHLPPEEIVALESSGVIVSPPRHKQSTS